MNSCDCVNIKPTLQYKDFVESFFELSSERSHGLRKQKKSDMCRCRKHIEAKVRDKILPKERVGWRASGAGQTVSSMACHNGD